MGLFSQLTSAFSDVNTSSGRLKISRLISNAISGIAGLSTSGLVTFTLPNTYTTVTAPVGAVVGDTDTQSLSNKRYQKRVSTSNTASSLSPDLAAFDVYVLKNLAGNLTISAPVNGNDGDELIINIKNSSAVSHTLTWNASYLGTGNGTAILAATGANTNQYVFMFTFVSFLSKWVLTNVQ